LSQTAKLPDPGGFILIKLNGVVIGTIKMIGDGRTLLALRNVFDSRGRLVLAAGGVYLVPSSIEDRITGNIQTMEISELNVRAKTFVMNGSAFIDYGPPIHTLLLAHDLTPHELDLVGDSHRTHLTSELAKKVWSIYLDKIQTAVTTLEKR